MLLDGNVKRFRGGLVFKAHRWLYHSTLGSRVKKKKKKKKNQPPIACRVEVERKRYRGTSLIRNRHPPLGPPQEPKHGPTAGSYGVAVSFKRGTPVTQANL